MSHKLLTILDGIARRVKRRDIPFGGIQVIFSGDFYQLPPVGNESEPETAMFCFENPLWDQIFTPTHQIELKHIFRQTDQSYSSVLNQIREGRMSKSGYNLLMSRVIQCQEDAIKPTKLLPRKDVVNKINYKEMEILKTPEVKYVMQVIDNTSSSNLQLSKSLPLSLTVADSELESYKQNHQFSKLFKSDYNNYNHTYHNRRTSNQLTLTQEQINITIDMFKNNLMAEKELILKEGAQVMCIINLDLEGTNPIVNGSRGIVKRFTSEGLPVVKFRCGLEQVMGYHTWSIDGLEGYGIKQIPLILAWAITIHKSQGSTLELAEIDIGSGIFECGQSYVALSRVKNIEGLYLSSFNPNKIRINKKAQEYYSRFKIQN
jgi:ATP-dependent DNA helicase PIF1